MVTKGSVEIMSNEMKGWTYDKSLEDNELFKRIVKFMTEEMEMNYIDSTKRYAAYILHKIQEIWSTCM